MDSAAAAEATSLPMQIMQGGIWLVGAIAMVMMIAAMLWACFILYQAALDSVRQTLHRQALKDAERRQQLHKAFPVRVYPSDVSTWLYEHNFAGATHCTLIADALRRDPPPWMH